MRAVIGQFSGPYSPVRPAKMFCDLSPIVLNFYSSKSLKLSFSLNCALNCASKLCIKLTHFAFEVHEKFEAVPHE